MQAQPVRVRPRGDLDGCAPRTLSPGPKSACAHLQALGDNRYGALPRPGRWRPPRPDPPPVRSCAPPLRAAAVVAPASQPRRPEAYPCRVSRVGAAAQPALRPTALPAPAAAVPLRSAPGRPCSEGCRTGRPRSALLSGRRAAACGSSWRRSRRSQEAAARAHGVQSRRRQEESVLLL